MVTRLPVVLSDLRSAARFAKPYGPAQCDFVYETPNPRLSSRTVYIASGDGLGKYEKKKKPYESKSDKP